jgi:hypothetical protein
MRRIDIARDFAEQYPADKAQLQGSGS